MMRRSFAVICFAGIAVAALATTSFVLKNRLLGFRDYESVQITDRNGLLLRTQLSGRQGTSLWSELTDISPYVAKATLAAEDKRFYRHVGVDVLAISRAMVQNVRHRHIVSGGSTITQQLVRTIQNHPRQLRYKLLEAVEAMLLELSTSKKTILTHFLNRAPYGNQCYGIGAAAQMYFNKPPAHLSLAEAAFLAGLPQSPTKLNPYQHFDRARGRQLFVLSQMRRQNWITQEQYEVAQAETIRLAAREQLFHAPHFCDWVISQLQDRPYLHQVQTTIDLPLQLDLEALVATTVKRLKKEQVTNAAVVVLDNRTREIRAMVGSANYFDNKIDGQVNGALAPRPPGSTWKPFTYGLALEQGMSASTILPDLPLHALGEDGDFSPRNYDETYHGPVRLRTALACSYNIPAVRVLQHVGPEALLNRLHGLGFSFLTKPASYYGLGLTLGGAEASLLQLAQAYSTLANRGVYQPAVAIRNPVTIVTPPAMVFSPGVAFLLTDILSDNDARAAAFGVNSSLRLPFQCAVKTGTSKNYRDSLTVGYTTDYTVAVWLGNFDGKPMKRVAGSTGAGLFFHDIMLRLYRDHDPENFPAMSDLVSADICPRSGLRASSICPATIHELFLPGTEPSQFCSVHQQVRIDLRNDLLATADCPEDQVRTEVFEQYDPSYRVWMSEHNIPQIPTKVSPLCGEKVASSDKVLRHTAPGRPLEISFPDNGDIFVIDPVLRQEYQTLLLKPRVEQGVESVEWFVDGKLFERAVAPFTARWPLAVGEHQFKVRTKIGETLLESPVVKIKVL